MKTIPRFLAKDNRGSILLITMFISFVMLVFFISISKGASKYIYFSNLYIGTVKNISDFSDTISATILNPTTSHELDNKNLLESVNQNDNYFSGFLSYDKGEEYIISNYGGTSAITGTIVEGGALEYKVISFNTGSINNASVYTGGVISTVGQIGIDTTKNVNMLYLQSLGGLSSFTIEKGNITLIPQKNVYSLSKNISGYKQFIGNYEVVNFLPMSYSGLNYSNAGLYLNTNK